MQIHFAFVRALTIFSNQPRCNGCSMNIDVNKLITDNMPIISVLGGGAGISACIATFNYQAGVIQTESKIHTAAINKLDGSLSTMQLELKKDISSLKTEVKGDIVVLRMELKGDISNLRAELKGDISNLRAELKGDISDLRDEVGKDIFDLRDDIETINKKLDQKLSKNIAILLKRVDKDEGIGIYTLYDLTIMQ